MAIAIVNFIYWARVILDTYSKLKEIKQDDVIPKGTDRGKEKKLLDGLGIKP